MNVQQPPGHETDEADTPASASASALENSENQESSHEEDSEETVRDQDNDRPFDWGRDVLIHEQRPLAVYWNIRGHVVIRAEGEWDPRGYCDEDVVITFDPAHLPVIISKLLRMQRGEE